jgi:hypothetical protein
MLQKRQTQRSSLPTMELITGWGRQKQTNKKILQILPVVSSVWEESCFSQEVMPEDSTLKLRLGR